ncbi:MAG: alpha/beta hydrolase [Dehalococcoidia bacterium]|nr:alpha/beta hydrolase [Dehalococcoidia bacterium]
MAIKLQRDGQQWLYDWMVKEQGKVFHFQPDGRGGLPRTVRAHEMISKHVGRIALRLMRLGQEEEKAGHKETALEFYFDASTAFGHAQHIVFENNSEKQFLHGTSIKAYDKVRELSPYPIEHVDVPWGDKIISGNFHLLPDRRKAPVVIFITGCDATKEMFPHPFYNYAHQRGMHILAIDGVGQGESNLRGYKVTPDSYEQCTSAVIDYLLTRDEVDADNIGVFGLSFGSFWSTRVASYDHRIKACVSPWASICDKYYLMNEESPRYKQLFSYLTGAKSEAELDEITGRMAMDELMPKITCPILFTIGEYDPRSPLQEIYRLFDLVKAPKELWVYEDQHHMASIAGAADAMTVWRFDTHPFMFDWLRERFEGQPLRHDGQPVYVRTGGGSPNGPDASTSTEWFNP